ncbi:transcriptional regulator [Devosia yakushimensis]|uniref:Transcriptional regulator n=1 Tax=Devosia yakushimensis TaxID=470028 RepID=A0ABQ5UAY4_9HYPH|nr:LysR family transcriptional regulator [Devosia yakushimensis]GLQ08788.1 transcriptional regulator [Devosia yakushimensis]
MPREDISDLVAFVAVANERSFTRAAARMGVSQSALSHTIRKLEARLGLRLLTRTTRSVSPTEAGERLLVTVAPRFEEIEAGLAALRDLSEKPSGTIRITATEHATNTVLWPKLARVLPLYPDIKVEIIIDQGFTDIAAHQFDAGVRLGEDVEKDMIAVRIAPDLKLVAIAAPAYLAGRDRPTIPQNLTAHRCINLRLSTHGGLYAWEFEKNGQFLRVRVDGQLTFNSTPPIVRAALAGFGIGFAPLDMVQPHLDTGELIELLPDWSQTFTGFHLYYPSRHQNSPAFRIVIDALRYRVGA